MKIGGKVVGKGKAVFIIAEAGVNHNGSVKLAMRMVDAAIDARCDAIKFQTFKTEDLVKKDVEMASYQKDNTGKKQSQFEMLKNLELSEGDFKELKEYCDSKGIVFLSTPHSNEGSVIILEKLAVAAYKLGSGDLTNYPHIKYIAKLGKPMILGTGMSTMGEVKDAVKWIEEEGNKEIVMLHCTTNYPCPFDEVNLSAMVTMMKELDCLVGYSDHTLGIEVPIMAVVMGAVVVEKHFTLDNNMEGPDHKASLEPEELKNMVKAIRLVEGIKDIDEAFLKIKEKLGIELDIGRKDEILGSVEKKPNKSELEIMKVVRKSILAKVDIKAGEKITAEKLVVKRPGTGISPARWPEIVGREAKGDIMADELISEDKI